MALTTLCAILTAILSSLPVHNVYNIAFLIAPIAIYGTLRIVGFIFRPARGLAAQPAFLFGATIMAYLFTMLFFDLAWSVIVIPIAAIWMAQVACIHEFEGAPTNSRTSQRAQKVFTTKDLAEYFLVGCHATIFIATIIILIYNVSSHVKASGSSLDSFWLISTTATHTIFDCQTGYDQQPWRFNFGKGTLVSGRSNPDWNLLGVQRYQIGPRRGAVHVSHWIGLMLSAAFPAIWAARKLKLGRTRPGDGLGLTK
jgi:hypothetical protein